MENVTDGPATPFRISVRSGITYCACDTCITARMLRLYFKIWQRVIKRDIDEQADEVMCQVVGC